MKNQVTSCRFCGLCFDGMPHSKIGPHVVWCEKNPKREENLAKLALNRQRCEKSLSTRLMDSSSGSCKHCGKDFQGETGSQAANHTRWCQSNPKRNMCLNFSKGEERYSNTSRRQRTPEEIEKVSQAIKMAHKEGKYSLASIKGLETKKKNGTQNHTEEAKEKIRKSALASKHQRVCKSTHDFVDKKGRTFRFDSTWEDALAVRLDELDIEWERPKPIAYAQDGKTKNYFADFYLPAYDLYLDPKNSYCLTQQRAKLDIVKSMVKLAILPSLKDCKDFHPDHCEGYMLF